VQQCQADGTFGECSCGSEDASVGGDGGLDDGPDAGPGADGGDASACYDPSQALIAGGDVVETAQQLCTPQDVVDAFGCLFGEVEGAACEALGIDEPLDDTAPKWPCTQCIIGGGGTSGPAPVVLVGGEVSIVNLPACQAAASGAPECGIPASQFAFCLLTACQACDESEGPACQVEAADDVCSTLELDAACETYIDPTDLAPECDGADFEARFISTANYFCGD